MANIKDCPGFETFGADVKANIDYLLGSSTEKKQTIEHS